MEDYRDLLVEIGTEELPPKALLRLSRAFAEEFQSRLEQNRIRFGEIEDFATPRRLAVVVKDVATRQPDQEFVRKGPALTAAYDAEGRPTKAAVGFARSCGVDLSELSREESSTGGWLVHRDVRAGQPTANLVVDMVQQVLGALPIPKRMRWGDREDEFVRPVHWVTLLFGTEVVKGRLFGVDTGGDTRGHRFHHPSAISVRSPEQYGHVLRTVGVVEPSFSRRREMIRDQVETLAADIEGRPVLDDELLDEVTALCEWPTAIMGSFDDSFLEVPPEVLIETMQKNQKYFPLFSIDGRLLPRFITVSNIVSLDAEQIRAGNERVIRPRFSDAAFFWHQDLKHPLSAYADKLKAVVFQEKLGTLFDKSARVCQISRHIAGLLGVDEELAARAAHLAKCDLVTHMIFEFPSLQGIMGRYYAERSGEHDCVAAAMEEQYLPRMAGDQLPRSDCGKILSAAEKLDTLVGIFAIGQRPTGVKDPYALRRAAIGLLRILIETPLALDLKELLEFAADELRDKVDATDAAREVFDYVMDRLNGYYQDQDISSDTVDAVLACRPTIPSDIHLRILAVEGFRKLPEAESLTAANKRIHNILRKTEDQPAANPDLSGFREESEVALATRVAEMQEAIAPLVERKDYEGVLKLLAGLRDAVDAFFENVMVMSEDPALRRNRLALLQSIESLFHRVADISRLQ